MRHRTTWWSPDSIRSKLLAGLLVVVIPAAGLLVYQNFYAIFLVRGQVGDSWHRLAALDMDRIDGDLANAERYLRYILVADSDLLTMAGTHDETDYQLAKIRLAASFKTDLPLYRLVSAFCVASLDRKDFLHIFRSGSSYAERQAVRKYVEEQAAAAAGPDETPQPPWQMARIGREWYLIRLIRTGRLVLGAWCQLPALIAPFGGQDVAGNGSQYLTDGDGRVLSPDTAPPTGGGAYLRVSVPSTQGAFRLGVLVPERAVLQQLPLLQWIIIMVTLLCLALPLVSLRLLRVMVLRPLDALLETTVRIGEGQLDLRMQAPADNVEFARLAGGFNTMMDEIDRLKIGIYEEQLDRQREELLRLQAQVNPHFFLNSLNIMYHLVQVKDLALVQELTLCLVAYFRFMVRSGSSLIPLGDELIHVRNYHRIQELRFPGRQILQVGVPDFLRETLVPPLVIQTFVENTIKYGTRSGGPTIIRVDADYRADGGDETVEILVRDNGPGFPPDMLTGIRAFGNPERPPDGTGHIGIANIRRRLNILFGPRAGLELYNEAGGGAAVRIRVPFGSTVP